MHRDLIGIRVFQEGKMDEILRGINKIYDQHRPVELLQPGQNFSNETDNLSIHLKKIVDAVISIPNTEASSPVSVPRSSVDTRATSISTDNSPDVTHVEPLQELAQRFKNQAEYDWEHRMYKDAEFHHLESMKCFEELHDAHSIVFDNFQEMNMMLYRIYKKLEKFEDAKMIVQTQLAVSQPLTYHVEPGWKSLHLDAGENTDHRARTSHDMAELLLAEFQSCSGSTPLSAGMDGHSTDEVLLRDAEHYAKRAFRIRRNLHEKDHESCKESARLLVEIYNNYAEKQMYAETYAYLYLPIISNRQSGDTARGPGDLDVAEAINDHTISPDDALSNVTSIDLNDVTDQKPALMVAMDCLKYNQCHRCHIMVDKLLRLGADRNAPFAHAVKKDRIADCKFLFRHGANIDWLDARGFTPLMHAVKKGNLEMISYLLGEQPDINVRGYKGQTVLHLATQTWVDDIFELLLETAGLDIDATDDNGMTAMHHAAKHDNVGFARILGRKANLEIKDSSTFRRTPLYIAIKEDKLSFAKALLKRGAQIDLKYLPKTRSSDVSNLLRKYQRQPSGSSAAG
jgi:hypothetical protein